jgi:NADH-quinone oxidoreductase subunit E
MSFSVPKKLQTEIEELISHYPEKRSASLMILHVLQDHYGYLSDAAIEWLAAKLDLQPINILELVTFYPMFRKDPIGKHHIKVCRTLSCALQGSGKLKEHFCRKLHLDPLVHGPQTTEDGKFTVEFVECLASCHTAPVLMCNEELHEKVGETEADLLLDTMSPS